MSFLFDALNSVGESYTENYFRQLVVAIEATPAFLGGLDPHAWLADVLNRIADHPFSDLAALFRWSWKKSRKIMLHTAAAA